VKHADLPRKELVQRLGDLRQAQAAGVESEDPPDDGRLLLIEFPPHVQALAASILVRLSEHIDTSFSLHHQGINSTTFEPGPRSLCLCYPVSPT